MTLQHYLAASVTAATAFVCSPVGAELVKSPLRCEVVSRDEASGRIAVTNTARVDGSPVSLRAGNQVKWTSFNRRNFNRPRSASGTYSLTTTIRPNAKFTVGQQAFGGGTCRAIAWIRVRREGDRR